MFAILCMSPCCIFSTLNPTSEISNPHKDKQDTDSLSPLSLPLYLSRELHFNVLRFYEDAK